MKKIIITALVLLFGLAACTSTQVTSSWKASNANVSSSYNKIMVLGIIKQKDRSLREELENQLVSELKEKGYDAHSALQEYGPKAFDRLSEEAIAEIHNISIEEATEKAKLIIEQQVAQLPQLYNDEDINN